MVLPIEFSWLEYLLGINFIWLEDSVNWDDTLLLEIRGAIIDIVITNSFYMEDYIYTSYTLPDLSFILWFFDNIFQVSNISTFTVDMPDLPLNKFYNVGNYYNTPLSNNLNIDYFHDFVPYTPINFWTVNFLYSELYSTEFFRIEFFRMGFFRVNFFRVMSWRFNCGGREFFLLEYLLIDFPNTENAMIEYLRLEDLRLEELRLEELRLEELRWERIWHDEFVQRLFRSFYSSSILRRLESSTRENSIMEDVISGNVMLEPLDYDILFDDF